MNTIDIPHEYASRDKYRATIGHKLNHRTEQPHASYVNVDHPRFGNIMATTALRDISKGQQVFAFYGYGPGGSGTPRWYKNNLMVSASQCVGPRHIGLHLNLQQIEATKYTF